MIATLFITMALLDAPLYAHGGGTPRLTGEVAGPYRIFVWSQPEPLRVGEVHLSIAVVKATDAAQSTGALDEPVTDATVLVQLFPVAQNGVSRSTPAVLQEQLGQSYYEADATLPTTGDWRFTIEVSGALGVGSASFVATVAAARTINWFWLAAAALLLLCALGLIGFWNRRQTKETLT